MQITADIFFSVWERRYPPVSSAAGRSAVVLRHIQLLPDEDAPGTEALEEDTLYIRGNELFTGDEEGPSCRMEEGLGGERLAMTVTDCWNAIFAWDHHICERILNHQPMEKIMEMGREYLSCPFTLIDRDMQVLYETPDYAQRTPSRAGTQAGRPSRPVVPAELVQSLLLRKEFHEAALRPSAFYYDESLYEVRSLCRNIRIDGAYYARLLMTVPPGTEKLPTGEVQLFELFADRVEALCTRDVRLLHGKSTDALHQVCSALCAGEEVSPAILSSALEKAGWSSSHPFLAGRLVFFSKPGWHTQIEYTLPYLTHCVEQTWPSACAVISENQVCFVVDLTAGGSIQEALRSFYSALAVLVRENVCRAGISSVYHHFGNTTQAIAQAGQALLLGQRRNPERWYYAFDDYRTDYALDLLRREGADCLVPNPALEVLRESDEHKGTEYMETLRAYFAAGCNMTLAADRIFIHRTTFCRRMERIRELTGADPDSREQMFELELALRLEDPAGGERRK